MQDDKENLPTWVIAEAQLVLVILTHNTEPVVLGIRSIPFKVFQIHTQHAVIIWGKAVNFIQSEPKFTIQVTKTNFVIAPIKEKNQPSRSASSETLSTLHRLLFGHKTHQRQTDCQV